MKEEFSVTRGECRLIGRMARSPERARKILCSSVDNDLHGCPLSDRNPGSWIPSPGSLSASAISCYYAINPSPEYFTESSGRI
jgi:hypothetical protein